MGPRQELELAPRCLKGVGGQCLYVWCVASVFIEACQVAGHLPALWLIPAPLPGAVEGSKSGRSGQSTCERDGSGSLPRFSQLNWSNQLSGTTRRMTCVIRSIGSLSLSSSPLLLT